MILRLMRTGILRVAVGYTSRQLSAVRSPTGFFVLAFAVFACAASAAPSIECAKIIEVDPPRIKSVGTTYAIRVPRELLDRTDGVELLEGDIVVARRSAHSLQRKLKDCPARSICFVPADGSDPRLTGGPFTLRFVRQLR